MKRVLLIALCLATSVAGSVASAAAYPTFTAPFCSKPHPLQPVEPTWLSARDVTVTGTASAGAPVSVRHTGGARYDTTAGANGAWSVTLVAMPEGQHHLGAYGVDTSGAETGPDVCVFGVDRTAPDAPHTGNVTESWHPAKVDLGGSSDRGTVEIFEGPVKRGTYTSNGGWRMQTTMSHGAHELRMWAIDLAGNRSLTAGAHTVHVDAKAPTATVEMQQARIFTGPVSIAGATADDRALHAVYLEYRDATGKLLATRQAHCPDCWSGSASARWTDTPPRWSAGVYSVTALAQDHVGNEGRSAAVTYISTGA